MCVEISADDFDRPEKVGNLYRYTDHSTLQTLFFYIHTYHNKDAVLYGKYRYKWFYFTLPSLHTTIQRHAVDAAHAQL